MSLTTIFSHRPDRIGEAPEERWDDVGIATNLHERAPEPDEVEASDEVMAEVAEEAGRITAAMSVELSDDPED